MRTMPAFRNAAPRAQTLAVVLAGAVGLSACAGTGQLALTDPSPLEGAPADRSKSARSAAKDAVPASADAGGGIPARPAATTATPASDASAAIASALQLHRSGKSKEARAALDKIPTNQKSSPDLAARVGLLELDMGNPTAALPLLKKAATEATTDWQTVSGLGVVYSMLGQQSEAQRHFQRALTLSPQNPAVLNNLALSYMLERKLQRAEATLLQAKAVREAPGAVTRNLALATDLRSKVAADTSATETTR